MKKLKTVNNLLAVKPFVFKQKEKDNTPKPVSFGALEPQELVSTQALMSSKDIEAGQSLYFRPDILVHDFNKKIYLLENGDKFILVPLEFLVAVGDSK